MLSNLFGRGKKKSSSAIPPHNQATAQPLPVDVTDADFATVVLAAGALSVVDFWADWCAPCRTMSAYVAFLAADFEGRLNVTALDVDENPVTAERYQILGLPTLLFLWGGVEVDRVVGIVAYDDLKRRVEQLLASYPPSAEVHDASV
jgi:thioredoxin 1